MPLNTGLAQTELVDPKGFMTQAWQIHFRDIQTQLALAPTRLSIKDFDTEVLPGVGDLPVTPILPSDPLQTGLYRVTATLRVTVPATTSSKVTVKLHWFDNVDCVLVLIPEVAGNATNAVGTGTALIHVVADLQSFVSLSADYESDPDPMMKYVLHAVLEKMGGA